MTAEGLAALHCAPRRGPPLAGLGLAALLCALPRRTAQGGRQHHRFVFAARADALLG